MKDSLGNTKCNLLILVMHIKIHSESQNYNIVQYMKKSSFRTSTYMINVIN